MRERLGDFYDPGGKTAHCFSAYFLRFAKTSEGSNTALLVAVQLGDRKVADHVWIHRSKEMKKLDLQRGDLVEFEACVGRYARREPMHRLDEIEYDFCLDKVRNMRVLKRRAIERKFDERSQPI